MKCLKKWVICFFLIGFNVALSASDFVLPKEMLQPTTSEKKLRNKIFSTVQNNQVNPSTQPAAIPPVSGVNDVALNNKVDQTPIVSLPLNTKEVGSAAMDTLKAKEEAIAKEPIDIQKDGKEVSVESITHYTDSSVDPASDKSSDEHDDKETHAKKSDESHIAKVEKPKDHEKGVLYQQPGFVDDHASVVFNFEDTDLDNVASYIESIHNLKFISEDIVSTTKDAKGLKGHKITFRTNKILSKKESWDLFMTFLNIAGLDVVPMAQAGFYKIVPFAKANNESIPTYIGIDSEILPDNDMVIRYVYFAKNVDPANIQKVIGKMQGGSAKLDPYAELKALIFTDKARNIKSLMQIVHELDRAVMPETLSVIKLKKANVEDVIKLYKSLKSPSSSGSSQPQQPQRIWDKKASLEYFPQDVATIPDSRTNSLILLGPAKGVQRIEEFIEKHVDVDVDRDTPPVFTYQLQYTTAANIQPILTQMVQYGQSGGAGGTGGGGMTSQGGVRAGMQYFQNMTIVPEPHSNKLIINSTKEDFEALKPLIEELDVAQKQVGLEVLIVQITDMDTKLLGSQISGPGGTNHQDPMDSTCQTFAQSMSAQTSGIMNKVGDATTHVVKHNAGSSVENTLKVGLSKLLGTGIVNEAGSVLLTFGQPIWAVFKALKTITSTHIVANPFVVVANNSPANVSIGESRRIVTSESPTTSGQTAQIRGFTESTAALGFQITPQINKGDIVNMSIKVDNNQFTGQGDNNAVQSQQTVETYASVANGEVLVLGGIMTEKEQTIARGVPFLEHIPILGWFFKSKQKVASKNHFLVFISPRLLDPVNDKVSIDNYTKYKTEEAEANIELIDKLDWFSSRRDPIQRAFFGHESVGKLQDLSKKNGRNKKEAKKQKAKKASKKDKKKKGQEEFSLDKDFLSIPSDNSLGVKHSIFKGMKSGKKYA